MRLDKFLKVSRLVKRRTVANELASQGRIQINGRLAKAGNQLAVGDILQMRFGEKISYIKVLDLKDHVRKEEADQMYEIIDGPTS
ncbi:MAG: RNA-binding S4 domain-containing protein [Eubacteriales bacterium]|nr:RNA-binding S4 domain-containing protein [Eubacteriales bacterium]